ncbi:ATP12 family protein [Novosphingobium sp. APW14]|jgi:chaperone required for assembly of F1-ATPase|uniref:ATP12 family chaperone protein n=1 Tax=Novosphingobium sp. APW14 TaxID=3077237 RepID=UPI0028DE7F6C|nr:ATP12 family protein [Novosphingobium sp. APW14]MDT9013219.1 ATP12 family protein [Novosphingobium sp. APW14]
MKRFYKEAQAAPVDGGWQVQLDGRGVKTAGGLPQIVPSQALAAALAAEWAAQEETIVPAGFVLRDMADYAIDVVAPDPAALRGGLLRYAETDTLCYRADPGEALHRRQLERWEPLLAAAETRDGVRFTRISGIIHQSQPPETLERLGDRLERLDPFTLAALNTLTSLACSLVIGLAALEPGGDAGALWIAAELEEEWQAEQWGRDAEAEERRARRAKAFADAAQFAALVRND